MKKIFLLIVFSLSLLALEAKVYNMQALGADVTGKKICTDLINKTIKRQLPKGEELFISLPEIT